MKRQYFKVFQNESGSRLESNEEYSKYLSLYQRMEEEVKKIDLVISSGKESVPQPKMGKLKKAILVNAVMQSYFMPSLRTEVTPVEIEKLNNAAARSAYLVNRYGSNPETYEQDKIEIREALSDFRSRLDELSKLRTANYSIVVEGPSFE